MTVEVYGPKPFGIEVLDAVADELRDNGSNIVEVGVGANGRTILLWDANPETELLRAVTLSQYQNMAIVGFTTDYGLAEPPDYPYMLRSGWYEEDPVSTIRAATQVAYPSADFMDLIR